MNAITNDDLTAARLLGHQEGRRYATYFSGEAVGLVANLTERERDVLVMLGKGMSREEATAALSIAKTTLDNHRLSALAKLGVETNIEAAVILTKAGLL